MWPHLAGTSAGAGTFMVHIAGSSAGGYGASVSPPRLSSCVTGFLYVLVQGSKRVK